MKNRDGSKKAKGDKEELQDNLEELFKQLIINNPNSKIAEVIVADAGPFGTANLLPPYNHCTKGIIERSFEIANRTLKKESKLEKTDG